MDERLRFVARLLEGEAMTEICHEFGISRKTGYKIFSRYKEHGLEALSDRSRRPVRYANQLPPQIEGLIASAASATSRIGAPARSASCWCGGSTATFACRPAAPSTPCSIATVWSNAAGADAILLRAHRCLWASSPTSCGAPTTKASSCWATKNTVTR